MSDLYNPHLPKEAFYWEGEGVEPWGQVGVLLMHGLTATPTEVRHLAMNLHALGYTVAAPLLPGHGTTPAELNKVKWADWVWETEQYYHKMLTVCDYVFVGGESTGAVVALYLATKHKEIVGTLNYAPAIKLPLPTTELIKLYTASLFMESVPKQDIDSNERWQGYPVNPLKGAIQLISMGHEVRRRLPLINQPTLVVQGRRDTVIHPDCGEIIREGVSTSFCEVHWMEESNHVVLLDHELPAITELTLDFMERALQVAAPQMVKA